MHGFAHGIITTEGKGDIGDSARYFRAGEVVFNPLSSIKEIDGVVIMLLDPCGYGEDVRIKNNIVGIKSYFIDKDTVGALADADFFLIGGGLTVFIKGHNHGGGTIFHDGAGMVFKGFLSFFQGDGINNPFTLEAFQSCFDDFPLGGINGDGNLGDIGFTLHELKEARHHLSAIDKAIVKADINDGSPIVDLLTCYG